MSSHFSFFESQFSYICQMKKRILLLLTFSIACAFTATAQGIGVISRTSIYQSLPGFMKDLSMIDSLQGAYENELGKEGQRLQGQIRELLMTYQPSDTENLASIKKRMSPSDTMALKTLFDKNDALKKKGDANNTKLKNMQKEKIDPVLKKIDAAIKKVATQEQLDVMYFLEDVNVGMAYLNERRDYTNAVVEELKKK